MFQTDKILQVKGLLKGGVESIKNKKMHLRFYRWSTECGFGYGFLKIPPWFFQSSLYTASKTEPTKNRTIKTAPRHYQGRFLKKRTLKTAPKR